MNKTNRVRIFYAVTVISAILCISFGYEFFSHIQTQAKSEHETDLVAEKMPDVSEAATEITIMKTPYEYMVIAEEGYLVVYKKDLETVYMYTAIRMDALPDHLQTEIETGKTFTDLKELYDFLENYSS